MHQDFKRAKRTQTNEIQYINMKYNFIREVIVGGSIQVKYLSSSDQLTDIMMKSLPVTSFQKL